MKLTPEKIAELKALAVDSDLSGVDSITARIDTLHEKDEERARAFKEHVPALIADLEEATATRGNSVLVPAQKLEEMQAEITALRKQLAEAQEQLASPYMDGYEAAKEEYRPQVIELESELDDTRKQLAEAQARLKEMGQWITDCRDHVLFPIALGQLDVGAHAEGLGQSIPDLLVNTSALDAAIAEAIEPYRKDAERYRWLTNDHDSPNTREACRDISARIQVMSYSAASQAIDAAIAAKGGTE